ncbi:hypothetical protein, partial [Enterobacter roggenkampii]|uniref:hypothetical protein n=1 Tax=Enterobacter roggenkampii TaxID=1812935 RepID=UPI00207558EC
LHGDVLMWLMKTLLTSRCINQRGAGHGSDINGINSLAVMPEMDATLAKPPIISKNNFGLLMII